MWKAAAAGCDTYVTADLKYDHFLSAKELGLEDKQIVSAKVDTDGRSLIFGDVVIRVSDKFLPAMHIDTDEANAAGCAGEVWCEIIK